VPQSLPTISPRLHQLLSRVTIWPRRLLRTGPAAPVAMLRGVWGAALRDLDEAVYRRVFAPGGPDAAPGYLLRPAPEDPALDWFLFGPALADEEVLRRAWDVASGRGLGPCREPFVVRQLLTLGPDGAEGDGPWSLDRAAWPVPADAPCRLVLPAPTRLIRRGRLILEPALPDLVVAAARRLRAFLPARLGPALDGLLPDFLDLARATRAATWLGRRQDLHRWSARQECEVDLHGVAGELELPEGVGELAPLLAAARWLHLGKGTVFGMGRLEAEPAG
jgi:hypothetical protein